MAVELLYPFASYKGGGGFATGDYCHDSFYVCDAFYNQYHNNNINKFPPHVQKQIRIPSSSICLSMSDFCGNYPIVWFAAQWKHPASHGVGGNITKCRRSVTINKQTIIEPISNQCAGQDSAYYTASTTTDLWVAMPHTNAPLRHIPVV